MVSKEQVLNVVLYDCECLDGVDEQDRLIRNIRSFVSRKDLIGEVLSIKEIEIPVKYEYDNWNELVQVENKEFIKDMRKKLDNDEMLFVNRNYVYIVRLI